MKHRIYMYIIFGFYDFLFTFTTIVVIRQKNLYTSYIYKKNFFLSFFFFCSFKLFRTSSIKHNLTPWPSAVDRILSTHVDVNVCFAQCWKPNEFSLFGFPLMPFDFNHNRLLLYPTLLVIFICRFVTRKNFGSLL